MHSLLYLYSFGDSMDTLSDLDYGQDWLSILHNDLQTRLVKRHFPWLINTLYAIPPNIMAKLSTDFSKMKSFTHAMLPNIGPILIRENEKRDV